MKKLGICLLLVFFLAPISSPRPARAAEDRPPIQPLIYDESADGSRQIAEALATASKENKRVLLQFGANWCIWCHRLHALLETDPRLAQDLKDNYVFVLIDVNQGHNKDVDLKYGNPTRLGLPVLVVLDADGRQLTTQDSGALEQGKGHDPGKVLAFLKAWAPGK